MDRKVNCNKTVSHVTSTLEQAPASRNFFATFIYPCDIDRCFGHSIAGDFITNKEFLALERFEFIIVLVQLGALPAHQRLFLCFQVQTMLSFAAYIPAKFYFLVAELTLPQGDTPVGLGVEHVLAVFCESARIIGPSADHCK